ncbi:penicillin-binding protein, partial [Bordetella hinzii]|nr:penicillin-binding protein [Bordetella hinzii]
AIDPRTAWLVDDIMHDTTVKGTAARVYRSLKRNDLAGKTGTTNGSVDVWFSGYNRDMVTTVWMGFDQPRSLGSNEFGSGLALTTWLDYASPMLKGVAETPRAPRPQGLIADNGNYYYTEFPPGQAIAALDLTTGDSLSDFLNNFRPADDSDTRVRQPGQAAPAPLSIPVPAAPPAAHAVSPAAPTPAAAPAGGVGTVQVPSAIAAQPL